jgi:hypothetical protein
VQLLGFETGCILNPQSRVAEEKDEGFDSRRPVVTVVAVMRILLTRSEYPAHLLVGVGKRGRFVDLWRFESCRGVLRNPLCGRAEAHELF